MGVNCSAQSLMSVARGGCMRCCLARHAVSDNSAADGPGVERQARPRHRREQGHRPGHHPGPRRRGRDGRRRRADHDTPSSTSWSTTARSQPSHVDLADPGRPGRTSSPPRRAHGPLDILVNNVGAVTPRLDGFLAVTDDEWTEHAQPHLPGRRPHDPRGAPGHAGRAAAARSSPSARSTRSCPTRRSSTTAPPRPRWPTSPRPCRRRSDRTASGSTPSAPGRSRPTCGSATTASPRPSARRQGVDRRRRRPAGRRRQAATGRFTTPARGRRPRRPAGQRPRRQRHRRRLRHRRRPRHPHDLRREIRSTAGLWPASNHVARSGWKRE